MKNKNINENNMENNAQKSIKWENIDALIGSETEQETLDFSTKVEPEEVVKKIDDGGEKHKLARNIGLAVITTVVVVSLGTGVLALVNREPSISLGEYREVTIEQSDNFGNEVWAMLVNDSSVDSYPDKELESIKSSTGARIEKQAKQYGLTLEQYISSMAMNVETYEEYLMETAKQEYLSRRVASAVAKAEGLEPDAGEYDELVQTICEQMGYINAEAAIETGYTMEELKYRVLSNIVREWFVDNTTTIQEETTDVEQEVEEQDQYKQVQEEVDDAQDDDEADENEK